MGWLPADGGALIAAEADIADTRLAPLQHSVAPLQRLLEGLLHRAQRLDEFELLALWTHAVDQRPAIGLALADLDCVRGHRRGLSLLFRYDSDGAVRFHLGHAAPRSLRFEVMDELVEIDVIADVEADMHRAGVGGAHMFPGLRPAVAAAHRLSRVAILQQLDDDVVELDEAHVQPLRATPKVGDADGARINLALVRNDLLMGEDCVVDGLTVEVA